MAEQKYERDTREPQATESAATDVYKAGIDLFRRGMERGFEVQKNVLGVVSQQNSETADLWRTMFRDFPGAEPMFNFAEQTVEFCFETHRKMLDIMGQQTNEIAESAKTQGERTAQAVLEIRDSVQGERQEAA